MDVLEQDPTLVALINDYGFPIILAVGMGYFIYYVWQFISNELEPEIEKMHVVLEYRERQKFLDDVEEKEALEEKKNVKKGTK